TVHLFRGRLAEALSVGETVLALGDRYGGLPPWQRLTVLIEVAAIETQQGKRRPLDHLVDQLMQAAQARPATTYGGLWLAALSCWRQDDRAAARRLLHLMTALARGPPVAALWVAEVRSVLALADGDPAGAEGILRAAAVEEAQMPMVNLGGSVRMLLAHVLLE